MQPMTTRAALMALGHNFNSHPIFAAIGLAHCNLCCRVWRPPTPADSYEALCFGWLGVVVATGWTYVPGSGDYPYHVDMVQQLSVAEALLWNAEPCTGPPRDKRPDVAENAIYRLKALDLVDWRTGGLHDDATILRAAKSWDVPSWGPMIAVNLLRAQNCAEIIPTAEN